MAGIVLIGVVVLVIMLIRHANEEYRQIEEANLEYQRKLAAMRDKEAAVQEEAEIRAQTMQRIEANPAYQAILSKALAYFDAHVKESRSTAIGASSQDAWLIEIYPHNVSVKECVGSTNVSFFNRITFPFTEYGMDDLDFESGIAFFRLFHAAFSTHYQNPILVTPKNVELPSRWTDDVVLRENTRYLEEEKDWPHRSDSFHFFLDFSNIHPKFNAW